MSQLRISSLKLYALNRQTEESSFFHLRCPSTWHHSFPSGSNGKESACNAGDLGLIPGLGRSLEKGWQPTPVFLPREFHGQTSLVGYSQCGHRVRPD